VASLKFSFEQAIAAGRRPRIMLINSPSNPTGQAFSESTIDTIVGFCRENGITLISDEIYSDIHFDGASCASACAGINFNAGQMILTGGLSKVSIYPASV
jgi:aspartate aminotransferase